MSLTEAASGVRNSPHAQPFSEDNSLAPQMPATECTYARDSWRCRHLGCDRDAESPTAGRVAGCPFRLDERALARGTACLASIVVCVWPRVRGTLSAAYTVQRTVATCSQGDAAIVPANESKTAVLRNNEGERSRTAWHSR
jgi:hypothetical protein